MPKIKTSILKSFISSARRNDRLSGGEHSKLRRQVRAAGRTENAEFLKQTRASELYRKESGKRYIVADSEYTDRNTKRQEIKKANTNRRRLAKVMPKDLAKTTQARSKMDTLYSRMKHPNTKVSASKLLLRIAKAGESVVRSPVSPAAVTFEIGMDAMKKRKAAKQGRKVDRKLGSKKAI